MTDGVAGGAAEGVGAADVVVEGRIALELEVRGDEAVSKTLREDWDLNDN